MNIIMCDEPGCTANASLSGLKDPFGKNGGVWSKCPKHSPRLISIGSPVSAGVPKAVNQMQEQLRAIREARRDPLTGERYCLCCDPENCKQAVPGLICKAGRTIWQDSQSNPDSKP